MQAPAHTLGGLRLPPPLLAPRRRQPRPAVRAAAAAAQAAPQRETDPRKRVVITGMGLVSVFGSDVGAFYDRLLAGESGVGPIDRFDAGSFPTRFAAQIRGFTSEGYIDGKNDRRLDDCLRYCIVSGRKALENAGLGKGSDAHAKVCLRLSVCAPLLPSGQRGVRDEYSNSVSTAIHFRKQPRLNFSLTFTNSALHILVSPAFGWEYGFI